MVVVVLGRSEVAARMWVEARMWEGERGVWDSCGCSLSRISRRERLP
jgi:hypothetical protein